MTIQFFLKRSIKRLASGNKKTKLRAFSELESMVIICIAERSKADEYIQWLEMQYPHFKRIVLINFINEKELISKRIGRINLVEVNSRQFNLFGTFNNTVLNQLNGTSNQLLINTDLTSSTFVHAIAASVVSDLKIGMDDTSFKELYSLHLYDNKPIDFKNYVMQVRAYLNSLNGNNEN